MHDRILLVMDGVLKVYSAKVVCDCNIEKICNVAQVNVQRVHRIEVTLQCKFNVIYMLQDLYIKSVMINICNC